jgi:hypothetical protein
LAEKIVWIAIVFTAFVCAGVLVNTAMQDWIKEPGIVKIKTFSKVK